MGVLSLIDDLPTNGIIALDTAPIIYFVEGNEQYLPLIVPVVTERIIPGHNVAIISVVTVAAVLVKPLKHNDPALAEKFRQFFYQTRNFTVVDITKAVAERAAALRASYTLKPPDAFQLAAAIENGAETFLTNDLRLRKVTEIKVLCLDDYDSQTGSRHRQPPQG